MPTLMAENTMDNETKPVSNIKKIGSLALLFVGMLIVYGCVLVTIATMLAAPGRIRVGPAVYDSSDGEYWALTLMISVIGIGLSFVGAELWRKWRLPAGIGLVALSFWTIPKVLGLRYLSQQHTGVEATWAAQTAVAYAVLTAVLLLSGIGLILAGRRRRHLSPVALPTASTGEIAMDSETKSVITTKKAA